MTAMHDATAALAHVADPLADRTVAAIVGPWPEGDAPPPEGMARLATATRLMAQWRHNADLADWQPADPAVDPALVQTLRDYLREGARLPDWTDTARVERAETLFMQEGPMACTLLFCASLPECYVPPRLAEVLHIAGQLEAHTEHRIRQTAAMVFPVMMKGGLTSADGSGVAQVLKVRLIHATIRHLILHGEPGHAGSRPARAGVAPPDTDPHRNLHAALLEHGWNVTDGLPCNQLELAYTLLTFHFVFLRGMRTMGLGFTRQDEAAFLHGWNVAGHVLGVQGELMAHDYASAEALFERLRALTCAHAVTPDIRPGLGRALMATMARSIRLPVVRQLPVPMTLWLVGERTARAIGIDGHVGWLTRVLFTLGRGTTGAFDAVMRLLLPQFSLARLFTRVLGYHLLSRFLLDQTRPLGLPDHVLNPLRATVADWHHEARAPGWLNRLEDRWTTAGPWAPASASGTAQPVTRP